MENLLIIIAVAVTLFSIPNMLFIFSMKDYNKLQRVFLALTTVPIIGMNIALECLEFLKNLYLKVVLVLEGSDQGEYNKYFLKMMLENGEFELMGDASDEDED